MRGQVAFESLVILLVVVTGAAAISSIYLQTHEDTLAISAARNEVLSQLSEKNTLVTIDFIKIEKSQTDTNLLIKTSPQTALNVDLVKQKIYSQTTFKNIKVILQ